MACLQQVDGHQAGLPVVAVDDVRRPAQLDGDFHHGAGEIGEPLAIVKLAIKPFPLKIVFVVDEIVGQPPIR